MFVILLVSWPLNERSYTRLGLDVLDERNIEYSVINLSRLLYGEKMVSLDKFSKKYHEIMITSWKELIFYLQKEKYLFNFLNMKKETFRVFWILKRLNISYISFSNMPLPIANKKERQLLHLLLKPASYGAVVKKTNMFPFSLKKTEFINIHSIDYDTMLRFEQTPHQRLIDQKYIVFLDQNLPYHFDFIRNKEKPYVSPENYYHILNQYFFEVEQVTGKKVVIALHPSSEKEKYDDFISIKHETINLIKYADAVLMHSSTAVSFAVLYQKPISMIATEEMIMSKMQALNQLLSSYIGVPIINIDKERKVDFVYSKEKFESYKRLFISDSIYKEKLSMEIVLDALI